MTVGERDTTASQSSWGHNYDLFNFYQTYYVVFPAVNCATRDP